MCRLSGYYIPKRTKARSQEAKNNLIDLVISQQAGGYDSTGLGFVIKLHKYLVHKQALPADQFMLSKTVAQIMQDYSPRAIIAHCRAQTQGDKADNKNNHPHFTKSGIVTIHNGIVFNDWQLFNEFGFKRDAEVDSEIIGKLIEYYLPTCKNFQEAIQQAVKKLQGSVACAIVTTREPDSLYLIRREGNLNLAYDQEMGIIYFATEREALARILYQTELFMGFFAQVTNAKSIMIQEIPQDYGVKITRTGIDVFVVESPPLYQYGQRGTNKPATGAKTWCPIDKCYWADTDKNGQTKCRHSLEQIGNLTHDSKAMLKRAEWESGVRKGFKASQPIVKPSKFTSDELQARLDKLTVMEFKKPLLPKLDTEARRIEQTLQARKKIAGAIDKPTYSAQQKLLN